MFIILKIEAVKNSSFWPFKSLMTSYMTQITIWSDRDRQDEQFLFYDLCQHMNSSKDICQKRQPLLGPLFKGPALISWYRSKGLVISNIFCSTSDHKFLTVFETFQKENFRGRPCNSLMGAGNEKMKSALCLEHHSEQLLFSNAFQNIYRFQDIGVQRLTLLGPLNP